MSRIKDLEICVEILTKQVLELQEEIKKLKKMIDLIIKEDTDDRS